MTAGTRTTGDTIRAYIALTKPRIIELLLVTTVPAMVLAILRRNVSEKRAFELITRGEEIDAAYAKEIGLINQVFSDDTFDEEVNAYVRRVTEVSSTATALTKSLLYQVDGLPFLEALESGADVNVIARMTEDCQQGIAKFLKPRD